jgi:hypothetical protein
LYWTFPNALQKSFRPNSMRLAARNPAVGTWTPFLEELVTCNQQQLIIQKKFEHLY